MGLLLMSKAPKDGLHVEYYDNGQKKYECQFKGGKFEGLYTSWREDGQKDEEGHYRNGEFDGLWTGWHENGQKSAENHWKDGKLDGRNTWWYENGQKGAEGHYKDGELDGPFIQWHENGQKKQDGHWKGGEQDGFWQFWYSNGQKEAESHWKNGKQDGPHTWRHENGQKRAEGHYKDGEQDGLWKHWHENGQKESEEHFENGEEDGLGTYWDENGHRLESNNHEKKLELEDGKPKVYFLRIAVLGIIVAACLFTEIGSYPLSFMLILSAAIGVHELGHLIAAKIAGIPVTTFRIGFGPRLVCLRWLEVNWELGSIPVLGYVVASEFPEPASDSLRDRIWAKFKTLFFFSGGVAVNFLIAIAIFWAQNPQDGVTNASIQTSKAVGHLYLIIPEATWDMIRPKNIIKDQKGAIRGFASEQKDASPEEKRENYIRMLWILNVVMVAFNLFPFPGLDGFRLLTTLLECFIPGGLPEGLKVGIGCISIVFILGLSAIGAFWMVRDVFMIFVDQPPENGQHAEYFESGEKKTETHYKNGKKQGLETTWYENGQKELEGHYKDGEFDGPYAAWHENGQKELEGQFKEGEQDGLWNWWHENGQKKREGHYKNGEFDGTYAAWHENGQKELEGQFKEGEQDGLWNWWHENGQKRAELNFKNDNLVSASAWKPDGEPCPITKIIDGLGVYVRWHENGQKKEEAHYKKGKKDGLLTVWDENGNKNLEIQYKDGVEISRNKF